MNDRDRLLATIHAAINAGEIRLGENRPDEIADALFAHGARLVPADAVVVTKETRRMNERDRLLELGEVLHRARIACADDDCRPKWHAGQAARLLELGVGVVPADAVVVTDEATQRAMLADLIRDSLRLTDWDDDGWSPDALAQGLSMRLVRATAADAADRSFEEWAASEGQPDPIEARMIPADAVVVTEDALERALEASDPQLRRTHTFGDPAFFRDWARIVLAALRGEAR